MSAPALPRAPAAGISSEAFRAGMRHLAGAVTVLAASGADGAPIGLAATAVCSLSAEPAALLACVNRDTSLGRVIAPGMAFSVNVLGAGHERLARAFGGMLGLDQEARFALGAWSRPDGQTPVLDDALVSFSCRVFQLIEHASHLIVIGAVERVTPAEGAALQPSLVYHHGNFGSLHATV
jgi:flavin reductase (DIM6/NTAB) family NADH-FMN oxidoreductase RutF